MPQSVDHAFFVCGKNRNNQMYWPKLRQFQTKSTRKKKEKKYWLKAGEKKGLEIVWHLVGVLVQINALCFVLIHIEDFVVRPRSSLNAMVTGGGELWE